jgi:hypothetical protein
MSINHNIEFQYTCITPTEVLHVVRNVPWVLVLDIPKRLPGIDTDRSMNISCCYEYYESGDIYHHTHRNTREGN